MMSSERTSDVHVQWIVEKILEFSRDIGNFSYSGDEALGETWAFTTNTYRDAGAADHTKFERQAARLEKKFPGECKVVRCRHWTHGWVDQLLVHMLNDDRTPTPIALEIVDVLVEKHDVEGHLDLARLMDDLEGGLKKPLPGTPIHPG